MGNVAGRAAKDAGQTVRRRTFQQHSSGPVQPHEQEALNKIAERDQERMKHLPSLEELNAKDDSLDKLLSKLHGSISPQAVNTLADAPGAQQASSSSTSSNPPRGFNHLKVSSRTEIPVYNPQQTRAPVHNPDTEQGRLQSYVLKEILEVKNVLESQAKPVDLTPFVSMYGADVVKLEKLFMYACIPQVGKVATFGHQYAFARAPGWFYGKASRTTYRSEPQEVQAQQDNQQVQQPGTTPQQVQQ